MKIGFHLRGDEGGGVRSVVTTLSEQLASMGHELVFFCDREGKFLPDAQALGETHVLGLPAPGDLGMTIFGRLIASPMGYFRQKITARKMRSQIDRMLLANRPDCIMGNSNQSARMIGDSCRRLGIPLISCLHGIWPYEHSRLRSKLFASYLNKSHRVVGVCKRAVDSLERFLKVPTGVVYNRAPEYAPNAAFGEAFRAEHNLPEKTTIIGQFGRLDPPKGYHILIDAVGKLLSEGKDVFCVIGGCPYTPEEEAYVETLKAQAADVLGDRCAFPGYMSGADFFGAIDIFAHTYLGEEGLSIAILEAIQAGKPVVAVNKGGPCEIITSEDEGLLIPSGDPEILAGALKRIIDDPAYSRKLSAAGPRRISEAFELSLWADDWLREFDAAIKEASGE